MVRHRSPSLPEAPPPRMPFSMFPPGMPAGMPGGFPAMPPGMPNMAQVMGPMAQMFGTLMSKRNISL